MTYALAVIVALLIAASVWKDREHRQHLERLEMLLKSKDLPEFVSSVPVHAESVEEPEDPTVPIEEAEPAEVLAALRKPEIPTQ